MKSHMPRRMSDGLHSNVAMTNYMTGFTKHQIHALNKTIVDDRDERNENLKSQLI
jgi:hypothetical protein